MDLDGDDRDDFDDDEDYAEQLVARAKHATTDEQRWQIIAEAWVTYRDDGASTFDWDFDSRKVMRVLAPDA